MLKIMALIMSQEPMAFKIHLFVSSVKVNLEYIPYALHDVVLWGMLSYLCFRFVRVANKHEGLKIIGSFDKYRIKDTSLRINFANAKREVNCYYVYC